MDKHGVTVVRRQTGGGAVYHDLGNLNYSFITELGGRGAFEHRPFQQSPCAGRLRPWRQRPDLRAATTSPVNGQKIPAWLRGFIKTGFFTTEALLFDSDPAMVAGALNADPAKFTSKSAKSVRSRIGNIRSFLPEDMELREFWDRLLGELSADGLYRASLTEGELAQISAAADEKYRSWEWTYGHSPEYSYKNKMRFAGGTLETELLVESGAIENARFIGDFMAVTDISPASEALRGVRYRREDVKKALEGLDIRAMFGEISMENILDDMFGGGADEL